MEKPLIIFTNYKEAKKFYNNGIFIIDFKDKYYKINLESGCFEIYGISLISPDKTLINNFEIPQLKFFHPTYLLLKKYKNGLINWDDYTKEYRDLLKKRKEKIFDWLDDLEKGYVYILCCYERTMKNVNCHRRIIYDVFTKSNKTKDKVNCVYRNGE